MTATARISDSCTILHLSYTRRHHSRFLRQHGGTCAWLAIVKGLGAGREDTSPNGRRIIFPSETLRTACHFAIKASGVICPSRTSSLERNARLPGIATTRRRRDLALPLSAFAHPTASRRTRRLPAGSGREARGSSKAPRASAGGRLLSAPPVHGWEILRTLPPQLTMRSCGDRFPLGVRAEVRR